MSRAGRWCVCVIGAMAVWFSGCSEGSTNNGTDASNAVAEGTSLRASTATSAAEVHTLAVEDAPAVFGDLASSMAGTPLFGVREWPEGMKLADSWWPVIEGYAAEEGHQSDANPRIVGEPGQEPEAQVLLSCGSGWLVILENFRGDLGEVGGEVVGAIGGQPATKYEIRDGWLIQWAFEGRWYGVFGLGVEVQTITAVALDMALIRGH